MAAGKQGFTGCDTVTTIIDTLVKFSLGAGDIDRIGYLNSPLPAK